MTEEVRTQVIEAMMRCKFAVKNGEYEDWAYDIMCHRLMEIIRQNISPIGAQWPKKCRDEEDGTEVGLSKAYHRVYIKDILKTIRGGGVDYVYDVDVLCELYSYEPELDFMYRDGAFYVRRKGAWD